MSRRFWFFLAAVTLGSIALSLALGATAFPSFFPGAELPALQQTGPEPLQAAGGGGHGGGSDVHFPIPLEEYLDAEAGMGTWEKLVHRVKVDPFNLVATLIFLLAVVHTFMAGTFQKWAHQVQHDHEQRIQREGRTASAKPFHGAKDDVSFKGEILHFLGEVEAIFGIWVIPLLIAIVGFHGAPAVYQYIDFTVVYTEPMFVVVIMAIAATKPVMFFARWLMSKVASLGKESITAWWCSILVIAPLLGSFITEPAAMTIAALLLGSQFYKYKPSAKFAYATIGLLFVNISVGGTLTHFAAPPVLMVAGTWEWDMPFMFTHFGWKATLGILISTGLYLAFFRQEFAAMEANARAGVAGDSDSKLSEEPVPAWIIGVHVLFLAWTVFMLHHPPLFIGGFLFFLAFTQATAHHQSDIQLKTPLLVGFFLAGLVTHGALQQWWISPVLSSLSEVPLFFGATVLTAFNDNAAITYLASLVTEFDWHNYADGTTEYITARKLEFAVVAGAVTGGGLTVIANAPNPAGQSILKKYFGGVVSPLYLFLGALLPTVIMALCFLILPGRI